MNPAHASKRATILVSMMASICLRWIEVFWKKRISVLRPFRLAKYHISYREKLRAQLQVCPVGGDEVDLQVNLVVFLGEIDHPLLREKPVRLADRQHGGILHRSEELGHMRILRGADKENLAGLEIRCAIDLLDHDFAVVDSSVSRHASEFISKAVLADDANHNGRTTVRECGRRPFHILGEVEKKQRLHLALREGRRLGGLGRTGPRPHTQYDVRKGRQREGPAHAA